MNWPSNHAVLFVDFAFNSNYIQPAQPNIALPGNTRVLFGAPRFVCDACNSAPARARAGD